MQIEGYLRLLSRHSVGVEDHQDIIDVLTAVQVIGRVRPSNPEVPNETAATPAAATTQRPSTTKSPSTSTAPTRRLPVRTPQVVPTPDPPTPTHIHPLAPPSLHPPYIHPVVPPSLHRLHILVLGLTFVHPPHGHFPRCHPFHPLTWVFI